MIFVQLIRRGERLVGYTVRGHALYALDGPDIVCAAISALADASANGLHENGVPVAHGARSGRLSVVIPYHLSPTLHERAQAILGTFAHALRQIQTIYPDHVRVSEWRCNP